MRRTATVAVVIAAGVLWAPATSHAGVHRAHPGTRPRPATEHVPTSVHQAGVSYRKSPSAATKHHTVRGAKARALVHSFNHLKREPKNYVICDIAGGPLETVVFRTATHVWTVQQSPCSEVQVSRDGKSLPTLLSDTKWSTALAAALPDRSRAVNEAHTELTDAPTLAAAKRLNHAPVARLRQAPSAAAYDALVERARWWSVQESAKKAYADLTAERIAGYTNNESGGGGGPRRRDTIYDSGYQPNQTPRRIAYASLQIAVTPTGHGSSAIGAYGQAVPRPLRPASESVPRSVRKVLVTKVRGTGDKHPLQRTIRGRHAHALVVAFDALPAAASAESACAEDHGQYETASFRSGGNVWVASTGPCPGVAVVRDGKRLRTLEDSATFQRRLDRALRVQ